MSQQCPQCRLFNPDGAMRCDCGYDFASGTMKASLVRADPERKRQDFLSGVSLLVLIALVSVMAIFAMEALVFWLPLFLLWAIVLIVRAVRLRREASRNSQ